jgi:hypothetical protein
VQMMGQHLKICHDHFLSLPDTVFVIILILYPVLRYTASLVDISSQNNLITNNATTQVHRARYGKYYDKRCDFVASRSGRLVTDVGEPRN